MAAWENWPSSRVRLHCPFRSILMSLSVLLAFTAALPPLSRAGDQFPPIAQEALKMQSEPKAPGAPAIYLYRQIDRDDTTDRETTFARIKVLTEEGRKYADIEIPFVKGEEEIRNLKARAYQADGSVAEFNDKVYEKTIVKAKGVKYLAKTFTLPDVRVGTIIEYSYVIERRYSYVLSQWVLSADLFTKSGRFSLNPDGRFGMRWVMPVGLPEGTPMPSRDGRQIREEVHDVPAFQTEDYMPPENSLKYRVEFLYTAGTPQMDVTKYWTEKGKGWDQYFESFIDKRKAMEQAVAEIVAPSDTPETKLQKIYTRVQQIHNTDYDREKTAQEEKRDKQKENKNVEDAWKRGYATATEINWLFVALARAAGIDATSVYVSTRNKNFFDPKLLSPWLLNSNVVLVKVSGKEVYLDPGTKFAPYGLLPWSETKVRGMLLDKDGGRWIETPLLDSSNARIERRADLTLSEDGTLEGKLTVVFGGLEALSLRTEERDDDDASRKSALEDLVKESVPAGADVELTNKPDWTMVSPTLIAEYHLKVPGWGAGAGRRMLFPVGLFGSAEKHLFEHAERVHPVYFRYPYVKVDDIRVALPSGWKVGNLPAPVDQNAKAVGYIVRADNNDGRLHITRTLRNEMIWLDRDQYDLLRQFFQFVRSGDEEQVVLQPNG